MKTKEKRKDFVYVLCVFRKKYELKFPNTDSYIYNIFDDDSLLLRTIRRRFMWSRVIGPNNCVFWLIRQMIACICVMMTMTTTTTTTATTNGNVVQLHMKSPRIRKEMYAQLCVHVWVSDRNVTWLHAANCHMLVFCCVHLNLALLINKPCPCLTIAEHSTV